MSRPLEGSRSALRQKYPIRNVGNGVVSRGRRRGKGGRHERVLPPAVCADDGLNTWIDYCGGRMFVVGYTEGGAPYGHVEWTGIGAEDSVDGGRGWIPSEERLEPF
jgi:hypothetical protein